MTTAYPAALDALSNPTGTTTQDQVGFLHADQHANANDAIEAIEAKIGTGASTPSVSKVLASNGTGSSLWRQVATPDIAANAATQRGSAVGSTSNPTTTSGTYVDMTDMSVTLTTTGGDLVVWFSGTIQNSTSGQGVKVALSLDGAAEVGAGTFVTAAASQQAVIALVHRFAAPSAASHTVKVRWFVSGGTGTAVGIDRELIVQEQKL